MSDISLLSIVRGRRDHLDNLLRGVARQTRPPKEVILVFMNEAQPDQLPDPGCKTYMYSINSPEHTLPLAAARNKAAAQASGEILAFLDVDCIPAPDYLDLLGSAVRKTRALIMGDVRYLGEGSVEEDWTAEKLEDVALSHPRRPIIPDGRDLLPLPYHLFWSLSFGIYAKDFARLGGFDTDYQGYGGEDTDFSFTARQIRLPLFACRARAFHQFHPSYSPPYNHLQDIVANAVRFHDKWQVWPMEGWLKEFDREGFIAWKANTIRILKPVDDATLEAARSESPFG